MEQDLSGFFTGRTLDKAALIDRGDLIIPPFLRPCRLKILMVVDGYPGSFLNVSFSHSYFGLSAVLDLLRWGTIANLLLRLDLQHCTQTARLLL